MTGTVLGITIPAAFSAHLIYLLVFYPADNPAVSLLHILLQTYLYTGLFITAHDSMHGSVSRNRRVNRIIGVIALRLFAAFSFSRMFRMHMRHHQAPGTEDDPDYAPGSRHFILWFFRFFLRYVTIVQLLFMAAAFTLLNRAAGISEARLLVFWVLPAFLSTFQLFYFGTYSPHRLPHTEEMLPHRARSQRKSHLWAMISCYFFGYHYEHHEYPRVPWWQLYRKKLH